MYTMKKFLSVFISLFLVFSISFCFREVNSVYAMPFYNLNPKQIVLRAEFSTSFEKSSIERKHNISLATKSLNNTFVDVNGEFSFNATVGERTEKRGYKEAKIIKGGQFTDGVGGGVCQVSTTLYNAVLKAGLKIVEYHPHSLSVNYVKPSFDAMVNSGSADFRFINNTDNPIIIKTFSDQNKITVSIYGEKMSEEIILESKIIEEIDFKNKEIDDTLLEYPDILEGEKKIISYGKKGLRSEGYIIKKVKGKIISSKKIRSDKYSPIDFIVVKGHSKPSEDSMLYSS